MLITIIIISTTTLTKSQECVFGVKGKGDMEVKLKRTGSHSDVRKALQARKLYCLKE